jgi:hypothetical protein
MDTEPCDFRCGYESSGQDLLEHVMHEHRRCPHCGNEPMGCHAVSHNQACPRLEPGYRYPEPAPAAAGTED